MRIRSITPIRVDETELERRRARYARLLAEGWTLGLSNLPDIPTAPKELRTGEQIRASEQLSVAAGRETDPTNFDALLPDCVLDPGVLELDSSVSIPVLGITRLSTHFLAACGHRFGVMVRTQAIADEYAAVMERYGLNSSFDGAYILGLSVEDISNDERWNAAIEREAQRAAARGTKILINGCSAVEVTVAGGSVRIVDPTALALRVADLAFQVGLVGVPADRG